MAGVVKIFAGSSLNFEIISSNSIKSFRLTQKQTTSELNLLTETHVEKITVGQSFKKFFA